MAKETLNAGAVYRDLAPAVLGYLRAERVADAEDLLGEVFLQITRDLHKFSGDDDALRRWVFTIAHNRVVDASRRRSRRPEELVAIAPDDIAPAPADDFDPELVAALHTLTADQREVILLRFVADLPLETVAGLMKKNVGSVKALQHRALENLKKAVSPEASPSLTNM
jgi:RNA polymerase sigma-70 factor (ECF subfamily)